LLVAFQQFIDDLVGGAYFLDHPAGSGSVLMFCRFRRVQFWSHSLSTLVDVATCTCKFVFSVARWSYRNIDRPSLGSYCFFFAFACVLHVALL